MRGLISFLGILRNMAAQGGGKMGLLVALLTLAIAVAPYMDRAKVEADLAKAGSFLGVELDKAMVLGGEGLEAASEGFDRFLAWAGSQDDEVRAVRTWSADKLEGLAGALRAEPQPATAATSDATPVPAPKPFASIDAADAVRMGVAIPLSEEETIALISLAQTMGPETFLASQGLALLNAGDGPGAVSAFRAEL